MSANRLSGLSVVIPCFNEEETLANVIQAVHAVAPTIADAYEIIVVDDGSSDRSSEILDKEASHPAVTAIHHPKNRGFGAAQRTGFAQARYEFVTAVPSDDQFPISDLERMMPMAHVFDIVMGYRENRQDSGYRTIKTRAFWLFMRLLFGIRFRDINWVKIYRREIFDRIQLTSEGIGIEAEILTKAVRAGFRATEVKVSYRARVAGIAKGDQVRSVLITIKEIIGLRIKLLGRALKGLFPKLSKTQRTENVSQSLDISPTKQEDRSPSSTVTNRETVYTQI